MKSKIFILFATLFFKPIFSMDKTQGEAQLDSFHNSLLEVNTDILKASHSKNNQQLLKHLQKKINLLDSAFKLTQDEQIYDTLLNTEYLAYFCNKNQINDSLWQSILETHRLD